MQLGILQYMYTITMISTGTVVNNKKPYEYHLLASMGQTQTLPRQPSPWHHSNRSMVQ